MLIVDKPDLILVDDVGARLGFPWRDFFLCLRRFGSFYTLLKYLPRALRKYRQLLDGLIELRPERYRLALLVHVRQERLTRLVGLGLSVHRPFQGHAPEHH